MVTAQPQGEGDLARPAEAGVTARLIAARRRGPLVVAHRGTPVGIFPPNSVAATRLAFASGADVVEIDVTGSRDGTYVAFHDGLEPEFLGESQNLATRCRAEIEARSYIWLDRPGTPARIPDALELFAAFRGQGLFNVDRSWPWWPQLLPELAALDMSDQLLLKSPVEHARVLATSGLAFPYLAICHTPDDVDAVAGVDGLELVGVELIAADDASPFCDPRYIDALHARGLLAFVNAETLNTGCPLFAGFDDERAVMESPDAGWGPLFDLGADLIQTDVPWLLAAERDRRCRGGMGCGARGVGNPAGQSSWPNRSQDAGGPE